ncbi:MAG: hypothetical protein NWE93_13270 [Candidatus Bathyarchaeota archaeon]|nr:hypothetical protein [Candidatus Bathyarchaeota archaeon]
MLRMDRKIALLLGIFVFAFIYRVFLVTWQAYPPGADIGFHSGVVNSITQSGNTNFLYNYYQMGGGVELEFPGFHIVASQIMLLTALPVYLAQALVAALFSSLVVLSVFLVTRLVWNDSIALVTAFLVAVSRWDIEILCWGGYPNITVLFLMPTVFYLFLKREKFTNAAFLIAASLLAAAILLSHSLSAAVFIGITAAALLAALVFPKALSTSRKNVFYCALPLVIGAVLVLPFLASAAPIYMGESATLLGAPVVAQALLEYRSIPLVVTLAFFAGIALLFLYSREYKKQLILWPTFLVVMWLFVPLLLTLGFLFGVYLDSIRFIYFLIYPILMLFALTFDYASNRLAMLLSVIHGVARKKGVIGKLVKIMPKTSVRAVYGGFLLALMLLVTLSLPIFSYPWSGGVGLQGFYQVMDDEGYHAIEWAKQNTPAASVFASEMGYGWWLAGVGQRPTITDVDFQAISLSREVAISRNVSYLLDTDYLLDNGYIQVREDGGYLARHNPQFLANLNTTNIPYPFFGFNSSAITLVSHDAYGTQHSITIADLAATDMRLVGEKSDCPSVVVNKANDDLSFSEATTLTKGTLFANLTINVQSSNPALSLDWLNLTVTSPGKLEQQFSNTLAIVDSEVQLCGQLIFAGNQPSVSIIYAQGPCVTQLSYNLQGKSMVEIQILVGIYPLTEEATQNPAALKEAVSGNLEDPLSAPDLPLVVFDYKAALQQYNVSYVVNRDFDLNPKYKDDPHFSLAFINKEVAIFQVQSNPPQPKDS